MRRMEYEGEQFLVYKKFQADILAGYEMRKQDSIKVGEQGQLMSVDPPGRPIRHLVY